MRLPLYLKNGGVQWRTLIPAETQIYLRIYGSVDKTLDLGTSKAATTGKVAASVSKSSSAAMMISWLGRSLPMNGPFLKNFLY
jgi:hypothetical protein